MSTLWVSTLLVINITINVAGSILLKSAATSSNALHAAIGCACYVVGAALYVTLLGERDLGVLAVVTSSLGLIATVAYAAIILQEAITLRVGLGIALTLIGVIVVSLQAGTR